MTWIVVSILGGFVVLLLGGELLVRGATKLAAAAQISPLIIGLTVVALGTSAPELAVSVQSCYAGSTDLAVGNAVGSNISNLLLILGISALAAPLTVHARLFRMDLPAMIAAAVTLWWCGLDGQLSRREGIVAFLLLVGYFTYTLLVGRRDSIVATAESELAEVEIGPDRVVTGGRVLAVNLLLVGIGLVMLAGGSNWLVDGSVQLAQRFGVSSLVIGLTVVAIGTSLPELVTSLMASLRGQRDLAVGNVVGSNILNIWCVLGLSAIVAPAGINVDAQSMTFDIPVMVAISIVAIPVFFTGLGITRLEGGAMVGYYAAYLGYLVWCSMSSSTPSPTAPPAASNTLLFLSPMVPFVAVVLFWGWRRRSA